MKNALNYKKFFLENRLLLENVEVPIIIIDVQPSYDNYCSHVWRNLAPLINNYGGKIIAFFNGPELSMESEDEVKMYFYENGVDEEKLHSIDFRPKAYAFFRGWMDQGMDSDDISIVVRYMLRNKINDSRDIDETQWPMIFGDSWKNVQDIVESSDNIYMPDIDIDDLKRIKNCFLCGGGRNECLEEIRILLDACDIPYKLRNELIY